MLCATVILLFAVAVVSGDKKSPIRILSLLPYSDSNGLYGWDRGLDLLPAARVAVKHVNNRTDILTNYTIQLTERASDPCGQPYITKALQNLAGTAILYEENVTDVIAVIGLACSSVTSVISPIADKLNILQLSMANSHSLRNKQTFPHLWRFFSTTDAFVDATVLLMERFGWSRVGLVFDSSGAYYRTTADTFRKVVRSKKFDLVVDEGVSSSHNIINGAVNRIQNEGVRIIFSVTTIPESIDIMCKAGKRNLHWPGYVWIFPSRNYNEFFNSSKKCDNEDLLNKTLQNVIFVDFGAAGRDENVTLISGLTYNEYISEYEQEYENVRVEFNLTEGYYSSLLYANAMYDEVWALALALNSSLKEFENGNNIISLDNYNLHLPQIRDIVEENLKSISFSGALRHISFDSKFQEVPTDVKIFQINEGDAIQIGLYEYGNLTIWNIDEETIPDDDFISRYAESSTITISFVSEVCSISMILLTVTFALFFATWKLRNEPEILASSPSLSVLIFFGCFQLILASIFTVISLLLQLQSTDLYLPLCYAKYISAQNGINLITTTVLVRLIRVHRVFTHFGKMGKIWKDKYLFVVILIIACFSNFLTVIGITLDPFEVIATRKIYDENPPIIVVSQRCESKYRLSIIIDQLYTGVLVALLLIFAILTRKVNKKNFKDTKKINIFVFLFTLMATMVLILSHVLQSDAKLIIVGLASHSYLLMVILCLALLIVPKTLPAFYYGIIKRQKQRVRVHSLSEKNATVTKVLVTSFHRITSKGSLQLVDDMATSHGSERHGRLSQQSSSNIF